jgi:hypothetical protein
MIPVFEPVKTFHALDRAVTPLVLFAKTVNTLSAHKGHRTAYVTVC